MLAAARAAKALGGGLLLGCYGAGELRKAIGFHVSDYPATLRSEPLAGIP
jgi:hypothetical protein